MTGEDLGSLERLKGAPYLHWYPSEVDVSIRPGWFWRAKENDQVKSLAKLQEIYFSSVGNNAALLLNVPPDRRGLLHETDAARLHAMGEWLRDTFQANLAKGAKAAASSIRDNAARFSPDKTVDGHLETFWTTDDWPGAAEVVYQLPAAQRFNIAMVQEQIREGQRISAVAMDAWVDNTWRELAQTTTVGYKRLLRFTSVSTDRVRVRILESRVRPIIAEVGLFLEPEVR
jgi:alpha-L-fucosidase